MIPPINLQKWIKEHSGTLLQKPINNYCLWRGEDCTIMIVGGPNKRTDYHVNPTEEFFYQHKGDMLLNLALHSDGKDGVEGTVEFKEQWIREGEMLLLPGNTPHNPVRFEDTIGLVIEVIRPKGKNDALRWYCENPEIKGEEGGKERCGAVVYQEEFYCTDLGVQLKPVVDAWTENRDGRRKCGKCGFVNSVASG